MKEGIIIFGPQGAGKTTLGKVVASMLNLPMVDIDDYIWYKDTDVPFDQLYPRPMRISRLKAAIQDTDAFVMAGSMCSFHAHFDEDFILAVFLTAPWDVRYERLCAREKERYGVRILPGGDLREKHLSFLQDAKLYDEGGGSMDRQSHEAWAVALRCPVLHLDGAAALLQNAEIILRMYEKLRKGNAAPPLE